MRDPIAMPRLAEWILSDGYRLRGRSWDAALGSNDLAFLYFHGIQSHGGWFEWSASLLASCGAPLLLPDRRGSGLNVEDRGDVSSFHRWNADVDEMVAWMRSAWGVKRFAVVGVSWGGKPATALALRQPDAVQQLLLITPGVFPAVDVGVAGRLSIAASLIAGGRARHEIPLSDPALFTDNPAGLEFIRGDERKLERATARFLFESARFDAVLRRRPPNALKCPTTLVLAERDRIIRNDATRSWAERIGGPNMNVVLLPEQAHTLEFSQDGETFRRLVTEWGTSAVSAARRAKSSAT